MYVVYKVCVFCLKQGHLSHACPDLKRLQQPVKG